jgi:hypothetical protein
MSCGRGRHDRGQLVRECVRVLAAHRLAQQAEQGGLVARAFWLRLASDDGLGEPARGEAGCAGDLADGARDSGSASGLCSKLRYVVLHQLAS